MKRTVFLVALMALVLAGCVVVPAQPVYYHPARVVVY